VLNPLRTTIWSSTSNTLIGFNCVISIPPGIILPIYYYFGAFTDLTFNFQRSADVISPFVHIAQAEAARRHPVNIETMSVIDNIHGDLMRLAMQRYLSAACPECLAILFNASCAIRYRAIFTSV